MENLTPKPGWKNRHIDGVPDKECFMWIIEYSVYGFEAIYYCKWTPFNPENYTPMNMPKKGYLGSAKVSDGSQLHGIILLAWESVNYEFIYYTLKNPNVLTTTNKVAP